MRITIIIVTILVLFFVIRALRNRKSTAPQIPENKEHELLLKHVRFYKALDAAGQLSFRARVSHFLNTVTITPVGEVVVTELDRLYVAAAAIIPIFSFEDWAYNNLNEVLIYPNAFTKDFSGVAEESNVLGMVGEGAMHRMMILTIGSLRAGFEQVGTGNTAIHEFVHLLDKADGSTDGVPEAMLPEGLIKPWMQYMRRAINEIRKGDSEINPYGGTNEAEFFAVISEYFFQKPQKLKENHPELWELLEKIYRIKEEPAETDPNI